MQRVHTCVMAACTCLPRQPTNHLNALSAPCSNLPPVGRAPPESLSGLPPAAPHGGPAVSSSPCSLAVLVLHWLCSCGAIERDPDWHALHTAVTAHICGPTAVAVEPQIRAVHPAAARKRLDMGKVACHHATTPHLYCTAAQNESRIASSTVWAPVHCARSNVGSPTTRG